MLSETKLGREMEYLLGKIQTWLYDRNMPVRARRFAERLDRLIEREAVDQRSIRGSILGNAMFAAIAEAREDWTAEVKHRRKKIALIMELRRAASGSSRDKLVPLSYVGHNQAALAIALHDALRPKAAYNAILEAERVFRAAGATSPYKQLRLQLRAARTEQSNSGRKLVRPAPGLPLQPYAR